MITRTHVLMVLLFVTPIVVVLAINSQQIVEDLKPDPNNGYLLYVTTDT